jgi:hypothetical protein
VDSVLAASRYGFCSPSFPFIGKPTLFTVDHDEKHHIFITFIFYHREVLKQDHYTFIELNKNRFVMKPLQNPTLCSSTQNTVLVFILLFLVFDANILV